jgi:HEPN domain-containing protein
VSLLAVLTFYSKRFLKQLKFVEEIEQELEANAPMAISRSVSQLQQLGLMAGQLGFLHLEDDGKQIFLLSSDGGVTREVALHASREFRRRLLDELARHLFFMVPVQDRGFFENPLLTSEAADCFPGADQELREAGKCFALERYTAAVFHAMRALEVALRALAKRLGVRMKNPNWENVIKDIEDAIRAAYAPTGKKRSAQRRKFLDLCAGLGLHFRFLKDAWRNHTMHARRDYDRNRAEEILQHVRRVIEQMAEARIREVNG